MLACRQQRQLSLSLVALEVVEPADALAHRLEVGQQTTQPTMVDVGHAGRLGDLTHGVACLLLGADEQHAAAAVGDGASELARLIEQALGLQQVDDVDAVTLSVQEAAHLGVPAARLVAEVHSSLQQLLDSWLGHDRAPCL
jgi:phosphatidylserine/phosphatidylglycerophosphate/cardiolipin synthase-like enzyme